MGDQRDLEPDGVDVEIAERHVVKTGLFGGADAVLAAGAGAVQPLKLDRVAGQGGEGGLEAGAVVVGERELRAGVQVRELEQENRELRRANEI